MAIPQWLTIIPDLAAILAVLIAAAGLIYTGKQLELSRRATAAQLLLQVELALREFDATAMGLRNGSIKGNDPEVQRLMGAMEPLQVLVAKGLIDAAEIDDLHGWRLEILLLDEQVRAYIDQYPNEWRRLTDLDRLLAAHREKDSRGRMQARRK
jgi:hypothetical protein